MHKLRGEIDALDSQIIQLLEKRMTLVKKIGNLKQKNNQSIYSKQRESEILDRLYKSSTLKKHYIDQIYNCIFEVSKKIEEEQ